jgi:hypothetical protein
MIALDDLLNAGGRTVEPEVMLRVGEDAYVGFELGRRHGRRSGQVDRNGVVLSGTLSVTCRLGSLH